uniref:Putative secreted protein n=1 Tax=Amblyomma parvum TaxID=251391 RepID=A0A023FSK3_AMBPA
MGLCRSIMVTVVALLLGFVRPSVQEDLSTLEESRTPDISEFLATKDGKPTIIFGISLSTNTQYPCKVDVVSDTTETTTVFKRYMPGTSSTFQAPKGSCQDRIYTLWRRENIDGKHKRYLRCLSSQKSQW